MPSFSRGLEKALHQAMNLARERAHEFATLEHLLLALTDDRDTVAVLTGCDVDIEALKSDLEDFINEELDSLVVPNGQDARPTAAFQRVIRSRNAPAVGPHSVELASSRASAISCSFACFAVSLRALCSANWALRRRV